jgi:hypothetical protein
MESNFNNREFEQYIKKNADQYRMIPSDKVWKGINTALHTRKRWYGIGLAGLLLLTGISVTWVMTSYPVAKKQASVPATATAVEIPLHPVKPGKPASLPATSDINRLLTLNKFIKEDNDQSLPDLDDQNLLAENNSPSWLINENMLSVTVEKAPAISSSANTGKKEVAGAATTNDNSVKPGEDGYGFSLSAMEDDYTSNKKSNKSGSSISHQSPVYPLTIESVVNAYKPTKARKKLSWQLYITPTISYRKLSANKSYKNSSGFADPIVYPFTSMTDVNKAVVHKPDMGLELGFSTRYPLTRNLKLRGGLQFNVNRYDIKAFVYNGEQATINLDDNNSVTAWTYYRNYNGYKSDWLKNFYFSVSAPIGAEATLFGNKKTSFGVAGTIQPTYILSDRAYLISTDYKNYANVPGLIRNVNVNTSFETFVNYTSRNGTKWQVGPQVRYQVLSSFSNKYPVRENLFDFGLKFGVMLNQ